MKKRKILFVIGISIVVLALGAWLFFRLHLSWIPMEDIDEITWQEGDTTVHLNVRGFLGMFFDIQEPLAFAGNERIVLRDGVRIRNGRPYINMRDINILNSALSAIIEADTSDPVAVIINGLYGQGTDEQNSMIRSLLGEHAREKFELYFQWCNTIHELGHLITIHNGTYNPNDLSLRHMVDEEQLVNSFAIAFWMHYGEKEKIDDLEAVVEYILGNITPPVNNMSHLDFMRKAVDEERFEEIFTFENYGWFQFNIVRDILRQRDLLCLTSILARMGAENVELQPGQTLEYPTLGTDMVPVILADVISLLRDSGAAVPDVYVAFNRDPNKHALEYPQSLALLEPNIAAGRVIPAFP